MTGPAVHLPRPPLLAPAKPSRSGPPRLSLVHSIRPGVDVRLGLVRSPRLVPSLLAAALGISAPLRASSAQNAVTAYDIVIRNGRVLDGAGNPWILADVAIKDGRFVKIGKVEEKGKRELDATGKYVSPGWIDMLDASGSVLTGSPLAESKLRMGVTTGIGGEGGTPVTAE